MQDLSHAFVTAVVDGLGKAVGLEAFGMLRKIVGLQDAQLRLLTSVDRKVDALLHGPFHAGTRALTDALASGREDDDRKHRLREARSSFDLAISQDPEPLRRSLAAVHLAIVWRLLGTSEDVRRHLEEAHDNAMLAVIADLRQHAISRTTTWLIDRKRTLWAEPKDEYVGDYKSAWTIHQVGPYVNALARCCRKWGTPPQLAPIFIQKVRGLHPTPEEQEQSLMADYANGLRDPGRTAILNSVLRSTDPNYEPWPRTAREASLARAIDDGEFLLWTDLDSWLNNRNKNGARDWPYWAHLRQIQ